MIRKDRQSFLSAAAKATELRIKRYREIREAQTQPVRASVRQDLIARGIIRPAALVAAQAVADGVMDRAKAAGYVAEVK